MPIMTKLCQSDGAPDGMPDMGCGMPSCLTSALFLPATVQVAPTLRRLIKFNCGLNWIKFNCCLPLPPSLPLSSLPLSPPSSFLSLSPPPLPALPSLRETTAGQAMSMIQLACMYNLGLTTHSDCHCKRKRSWWIRHCGEHC
jgi:hypothetical protein